MKEEFEASSSIAGVIGNSTTIEELNKGEPDPEITKSFQVSTKTLENKLKIKILSPKAIVPIRATSGSIGYDLYATNNLTVPKQLNALIPTRLAMTPPKDCYIRIAPRSGLALKKYIQVGAGVVDPDYTGEIKVILFNQGKNDFEVKQGDKVAQIVLEQAKNT